MKTFKGLFIILFVCSFVITAEARVSLKKTKRLILPTDISEPAMTAETSQKILPKSVTEEESGSSVVSKMVDNTISYLWETSPFRKTSIGRAAEKVEKNMKAEVDFGKVGSTKTDHK